MCYRSWSGCTSAVCLQLCGEMKSVIMFSQGLCVQSSKNESNQFIYYLYIFILYVK